MLEEYNIGNKYKLITELSAEPFGTYYSARSMENQEHLILILNKHASNFARANIPKLQEKLVASEINYNNYFWPVTEILDDEQNITLVMPSIDGCTLATYISNLTKPLKLNKALKLLIPLVKKISLEHKTGRYHGFINFSTVWVTSDKKLKLLGFDIFSVIFEKLEIKSSEFYHPKISSCMSEDNHAGKIVFSIASDYYSLLVILCSLLNGTISSAKTYVFEPIKQVNKKTRKLLTPDYYRSVYQNNFTLEDWFLQMQSSVKWPILENTIAIALVASLTSVLIYQNRVQLQKTELYAYSKKIYHRAIDYITVPTNLKLASSTENSKSLQGSAQKSSTRFESVEPVSINTVANDVVADLVSKNSQESQRPDFAQTVTQSLAQGLVCTGAVCREPIVDLISGPKMIKTTLLDQQVWVMQSPVTRRDYYTYCFFVDDCKQKSIVSNNNVLKCLFENECTSEANVWLDNNLDNIAIDDLNKYITWLNKVTKGGYQIMPDKFWSAVASSLKPENDCHAINVQQNRQEILASERPELVLLDNKDLLGLRIPAKVIDSTDNTGEHQCQSLLITENIPKEQNGNLVRLVKVIG